MRRDEAFLLDMLLAARDAVRFVSGMSRPQFEESRLHQHAVLKAIEIVGEAAGRISKETREKYPHIPWADMIAMRNRLVHGYFEIDLAKVWDTVHRDLPRLIEAIELLVPPE